MIKINHLSKIFSTAKKSAPITALNDVSLEFHDGEITGLLGLNGAGKSTLMRLVYGLLEPTEGNISVDNISLATSPDAVRKQLGILPDDTGLYRRLTARENITYFGQLQGMPKFDLEQSVDQLISWLGMETIADRRAEGFSLGERMKTALARAIVHQPQNILLDEPTNGLDVITTRAVRSLLRELKAQGRCILFSSHLMHEVGGLCDRIVVIANGSIVANGTLAEIMLLGNAHNLEDAFVNLVHSTSVERI